MQTGVTEDVSAQAVTLVPDLFTFDTRPGAFAVCVVFVTPIVVWVRVDVCMCMCICGSDVRYNQ